MAGVIMERPFQTYPNGFPKELISEFERKIGRGTLGNCVASGTVIIQQLGDEHVRTGKPIIYTSADSVFQIAAHEQVIPLADLYAMCETARAMLVGDNLVGRVIARPFLGSNGAYTRTENRRDYAVEPVAETILDRFAQRGLQTVSIGKIEDIFCHRNVGLADHTKTIMTGSKQPSNICREMKVRLFLRIWWISICFTAIATMWKAMRKRWNTLMHVCLN